MGNTIASKKVEGALFALRVDGATIQEIVEKTGATYDAVVDTISAAGYSLKNLQAIANEAKIKGLGANRLSRLTSLALMRDKVQAEIESRDLSDVPTDKLITLFVKLNESIKEEVFLPTILPTEAQNVESLWELGKDSKEMNIAQKY